MTPTVASCLLRARLALSRLVPAAAAADARARNLRSVTVLVALETELPQLKDSIETARALYGDLKARQIHVASADGSRVLFLLPKENGRRLAGRAPGAGHIALQAGAHLASGLLAFPPFAAGGAPERRAAVHIELSGGVRERVGSEKAMFLVGLQQRSFNTKIKPGTAFSNVDDKALLVNVDPDDFSEKEFESASHVSDSMCVTRSLVNMPSNLLNPETYEVFVRELVREECARNHNPQHLNVEVYRHDKLAQEGCGLICAVGQGSAVPPRIVKLTYMPKAMGKAPKHVVLVGKGITFDSGGLDIKGSAFMRNMKKDMGGSAAALGAFLAVARLGLPVRVTCYLALAENMVSDKAMRPGDVYTARNGISVEIDNTDAEGRLVLADALCYAQEEKPDWIIDLATLTGAARTALGPMVDALFSTSPEHEALLADTAVEVGDWVWPMPLVDEYESWLDSGVADIVNSPSSGHGGAITAALFLKKFVGQVPWSHLDTYMWADKPTDLTQEPGATAKCVRLLARALEKFAHS